MTSQEWADELGTDTASSVVGEGEPQLYFSNVDVFVRQYLLPNWRRATNLNGRWCAKWWEHAEAITRMEALWESWEQLRLQPGTGMATWWRDYADPHMAVLTDAAEGPFKKCDAAKGTHEVPPIWPTEVPPEGMFRDGNEEIG